MTRYVYRVNNSDNELQHFDISDIGKGLNAAGKAIGDAFSNLTGQKKNKSGKVVAKKSSSKSKSSGKSQLKVSKKSKKLNLDKNKKREGDYKGGKKDREWKNHKYGSRKRNEDGKWVYDTDGVKGLSKSGFGSAKEIKSDQTSVKVKEASPIYKFLHPIVGLGEAVIEGDVINGGKKFIGGLIEGGKQIEALARKIGKETDETGLAKKDGESTKEEDLKIANPGWENPDMMSQNNCPCTSVAYEMRRRGYEVTARETAFGVETKEELASFFKDPKVYEVTADFDQVYVDPTSGTYHNEGLATAVENQMSQEPDGSRGVAYCQWYPGNVGGHIFNYEIENGEPVIYDAQSGEKHDMSYYSLQAADWHYYRTDNLEPNIDEIKKVVK